MPVPQGRGDTPRPSAIPPAELHDPASSGIASSAFLLRSAIGVSRLSQTPGRQTATSGKSALRAVTPAAIAGCLIALAAGAPGLGSLNAATVPNEPRNFFTNAQESALGSQLAAEFDAAVGRFDNGELGKYVAALGARLTAGSKKPAMRARFRVFADSVPHAFAFPGGPVYISTGMIASAQNEAQLAGLLAHSLAHSILRHSTIMASRNEPFRIRAALAAAATGRSTMLQSMRAIGMDPGLGGDLLSYTPAAEREAGRLAGRLLIAAGYDPKEMAEFVGVLRSGMAGSFGSRHPEADAAEGAPPGAATPVDFLAGPKKFARLKARASKVVTVDSGVAALLEPKPSAPVEARPTGPREIYRTPEFEFAYPLVWRPNRPGPGEPLVVTPQGGMYHPAGSEPRVETGMIGGSFLSSGADRSAIDSLIQHLRELRPWLIFATDQQLAPPALSAYESALFEGDSPLPNHRELVWAIATRKQESVYYLLLIAPKNTFGQIQTVFAESVRSFQVH